MPSIVHGYEMPGAAGAIVRADGPMLGVEEEGGGVEERIDLNGWPKRSIRWRRRRLSVQFGDQTRQAGDAIAEQRRMRTVFQMLDAITPVGRRKRLPRRAGDHTFQMNEFAFENVVMHCLNPREWLGGPLATPLTI